MDGLTAESLALCITSDVRPLAGLAGYVDWRLCGRLSALIRAGVITGARGESVLVSTQGALHTRRVFVFGWGERSAVEEDAPAYFEQIARALVGAGCDSVAFAMPEPGTRLLHLVEDHVRKALGARCVAVFGPDPILAGAARASSSAPATPLQPTRAHALPA